MTMKRSVAFAVLAALCVASTAAAAPQPTIAVVEIPVARGELIDAAALTTRPGTDAEARGALPMGAIVGKEARRALMPGMIVRALDVQEPELVKKGQAVSMVLRRGPLTIAASGRAMESGAAGKLIRVQNLSSKQVIDAEVVSQGLVRVTTAILPAALAGNF